MRLSGNDLLFFAKRTHLETLAIEFIDENGGGPGVRLRKRLATAGSLIFTGYWPEDTVGSVRAHVAEVLMGAPLSRAGEGAGPSAHAGKWSTVE